MRCIAGVFLLFYAAVYVASAQRPLIKIGWTVSRCGAYFEFSTGQEVALSFWENYTNSHGGVNVNGIVHDVKIIKYNDASDPSLGRASLLVAALRSLR